MEYNGYKRTPRYFFKEDLLWLTIPDRKNTVPPAPIGSGNEMWITIIPGLKTATTKASAALPKVPFVTAQELPICAAVLHTKSGPF